MRVDQFRSLFGAARVPKCRSRDKIVNYEKSNHVAVMCRNQLFYFQALWPDNGDVAVDEADLVHILEAIQTHATKLESRGEEADNQQKYLSSLSALGVLTSLDRNQWARAREEMMDHSTKNVDSFRVIDSALFVLVLDDYVPKTKHEAAANMLHGSYQLAEWWDEGDACAKEYQSGSCTNRWYDKLQVSAQIFCNARNGNPQQFLIFPFFPFVFTKDHCDCRWWCRNQFRALRHRWTYRSEVCLRYLRGHRHFVCPIHHKAGPRPRRAHSQCHYGERPKSGGHA